jgi:hypothetical protein
MHSWFDTKSLERPKELNDKYLAKTFNQEEIKDSVQVIEKIIEQEVQLLGHPKRVFLGGF